MAQDMDQVGQGRQHEDATKKYDADHGKYEDGVHKIPADEKLPLKANPLVPEKTPFALGPLAGGERGK